MKRRGRLWEMVISLPNLFRAAHAAARGKRRRDNVAACTPGSSTRGYIPSTPRGSRTWRGAPVAITGMSRNDW